jgi:phage/plasmid-associated DNA primase
MCLVEGCKSKLYNETDYCYRHRGQVAKQVKSAPIEVESEYEDILSFAKKPRSTPPAEIKNVVNENTHNIVEASLIEMPPNATQYINDTSITIANESPVRLHENDDKVKYFQSLGFVLGNLKLEFNEELKTKECKWTQPWKDGKFKAQPIKTKNFYILTGAVSGITVIDLDCVKHPNLLDDLLTIGIDWDDYIEHSIKIRTQSGGFHYIFKYKYDLKSEIKAFGIEGLDILNDEKIIFAGYKYDIIHIGEKFHETTISCGIIDEPIQLLREYGASHTKSTQPKQQQRPTKPIKITDGSDETISQKFYDLINLLPDEYFNRYDLWTKPIYALKNCAEISKEVALNTMIRLLDERSDSPNEDETRRIFSLEDTSKKKFGVGSIINLLKNNESKKQSYFDWNAKYNPKKEQKDTLLSILKKKLLNIVRDDFKREYKTGAIYYKKLPFYYQRKYDDTKEFLNYVFENDEMYHLQMKAKDHSELMYFIKNISHPDFPFINLDNDYIGFNNGVYDLSTASFIPTNEINQNIQVRTFIDITIDLTARTPLLDQYMNYQFYDPDNKEESEETIEFVYFMLGRLLTNLNDKFDFMVMLFGVGGSGKSLLLNLIKYAFSSNQIGILSNSHQETFGLSEYAKRQILCCDDMDNLAKTLPKADFLSMATRGSIQCPVKKNESIQVDSWDIPTIINSNKLPNYKDESGEVVRRFMVINFPNIIPEDMKNVSLEEDIKSSEFGQFIHKCRSTYLRYYNKYKNNSVESFAPPVFVENRELLRAEVNNTCKFASECLRHKEGNTIPTPALNKAFKKFLKSKYESNQTPKDNINKAMFSLVDKRYEYVSQNICKSCRKKHQKDCCVDYNRLNRTKREFILNVEFDEKAISRYEIMLDE